MIPTPRRVPTSKNRSKQAVYCAANSQITRTKLMHEVIFVACFAIQESSQ